jgi:hypothetical protein
MKSFLKLTLREFWLKSVVFFLVLLSLFTDESWSWRSSTSTYFQSSSQRDIEWILQPTTVKCVGECCNGQQRSRSCVWTNLWYVNRKFYAVGTNEDRERNGWAQASEYVVQSNPRRPKIVWDYPLFQPDQKVFNNTDDFRHWVNEMMADVSFKLMNDGIVMPIYRGTGFNFGHGILDELFPLFYSALKVGAINQINDAETSFTPLIMSSSIQANPGERPEQWIRAICGRDLQFENQWPPHSIALMSSVISGLGHMGLTAFSDTYTSQIGPEVDAMRMFRDRAYRGFGLTPPVRLIRPSDRFTPPPTTPLLIGIFKNKRDFIDNYAALNNSSLLINERKVLPIFVDFPNMDPKTQLEIIGKLDVVYTGPGTAFMAGFLLPDGAIIILAGTNENGAFGYMEEYFARGLYFTRTFYTGMVRIDAKSVVPLLLQAYNEVVSDTASFIPISAHINSSPIGMIMEEYFASDPMLWMTLIGDYGSPNVDCLSWGERVICGISYLSCYPFNETKMALLREKYNWQCRM